MGTIIHNQERQRSSGTALGLRLGMYRTTCAVGTTGGRVARLGCSRRRFRPSLRFYDLLKLGRASARPLFAHSGYGVGCSRYHFASKLQHEIAIEKASGDDTLEDLEGEARALASKIAAKKAALKATA